MRYQKLTVFLFGMIAFLSGCTRVPDADCTRITKLVEPRIGKQVQWHQGVQEDILLNEMITLLLQNELSLDSAIYISLLRNRLLHAFYEEIGISQADLVQAGLLRNPLFSIAVGFLNQSGSSVKTQFSLTQNFIDIFSISLRKKCALLLLEQTELRVAKVILDHVAQVEIGYYNLQAEMNKRELLETIVEIETAAAGLSEKQHEAGNVYQIEVTRHQKQLYAAKIALAKSTSRILVLREQLNELLGLWGKDTAWTVPVILADVPDIHEYLDRLENIAMKNRLDLKIAKKEVELMANAIGLKEWWTYTEGQIGILTERDPGTGSYIGPILGFALPIFDCGQADRARLKAKLQQSYENMLAVAVRIRAEVRAARETFLMTRDLAYYLQKVIIPLQQKTMQLSQRLYNSMTIGAYELLNTKREEVLAKIDYVEALREYWLAYVELGNKVGGKLLLTDEEATHE